jgi:hypothetical protein
MSFIVAGTIHVMYQAQYGGVLLMKDDDDV